MYWIPLKKMNWLLWYSLQTVYVWTKFVCLLESRSGMQPNLLLDGPRTRACLVVPLLFLVSPRLAWILIMEKNTSGDVPMMLQYSDHPRQPRRILPVSKLINVCERLVQAEDLIELSRPPVFLRLAGNNGWVFDRRGHTLVCEDVTEKSRYIYVFVLFFWQFFFTAI